MNELSEYLLQFKSLESHKIKFYDLHINDVNEDKSFYEKYIVYGKLGFVKFIVLDNEIIDHVFIAPKYISGIFWNKCVTVQEIKNVLYMHNFYYTYIIGIKKNEYDTRKIKKIIIENETNYEKIQKRSCAVC
jgi:hypothetical protein